MTGYTRSSDFPTTFGALDTGYHGDSVHGDAFVARLGSAGSRLEYSTFLAGESDDEGQGVVLDAAGRVYVTGYTGSSDFPTTPGAFDTSYGWQDAYVTKLWLAVEHLYLPALLR